MAEPLTFLTQAILGSHLEPFGVLDESVKLCQASLGRRRAAGNLVIGAARRGLLPPGHACFAAQVPLLVADEGVQRVQLVGRPRQPALFELPRHRQQTLACGGQILASGASPPGVRARASVGEHPPGQHQTVLTLGPQVGQRFEALLLEQAGGDVELRLDVGLFGSGAEVGRVPLGSEEEADRLREDRLARAGLAGDRVQPGRGREIGLADQHEVLDAQPTKQKSPCTS